MTNPEKVREIHENVRNEYAAAVAALKNGKFDEVIRLSYVLLEWMPDCAEAFWMRLLARCRCRNDEELVCHGCRTSEDGDYLNAVEYGSREEKKRFSEVGARIEAVRKALCERIKTEKHRKMTETKILSMRTMLNEEIEEKKDRLYDLWEELQKTEARMYTLQKQCELAAVECYKELEEAEKEAKSLRKSIDSAERLTEDMKTSCQIKLEAVRLSSGEALGRYKEMLKKTPQIREFEQLTKKRDEQISRIDSELAELKKYIKKMEKTLRAAEDTEKEHDLAYKAAGEYDFGGAVRVLDRGSFERIVEESAGGTGGGSES